MEINICFFSVVHAVPSGNINCVVILVSVSPLLDAAMEARSSSTSWRTLAEKSGLYFSRADFWNYCIQIRSIRSHLKAHGKYCLWWASDYHRLTPQFWRLSPLDFYLHCLDFFSSLLYLYFFCFLSRILVHFFNPADFHHDCMADSHCVLDIRCCVLWFLGPNMCFLDMF